MGPYDGICSMISISLWKYPAGIRTETVRDALEKNPGVRADGYGDSSYSVHASKSRKRSWSCGRTFRESSRTKPTVHSLYCAVSRDVRHFGGRLRRFRRARQMLGSLTRSSMLRVQGGLVDRSRLRALVSMMNTTSPSYLLMSSLDAVRRDMAQCGRAAIWENVFSLTRQAAEDMSAIPGMHCVTRFFRLRRQDA